MLPAALTLLGVGLAVDASPARAQMAGAGRSLGGYGAATISSYYGRRGGPLIPSGGGGGGGYIPYRGLQAREPGAAAMMRPRRLAETPIGGAGMMGPPIGGASRMMGPRIYTPFGSRGGMGLGPGPARMPGGIGRGSRPPGLGYPFRQPPGLGGGGGGGGMGSM
jgi:hypothetical protein